MVSVVAVIPARAGSRRIPSKNTKLFCGIPSLVRAIDIVLSSSAVDQVLVSTDDQQTAELAREHGAMVPALRPKDLADDLTPTRPVIVHAIQEWLDDSVDIVACVYAVTPLLPPELLRESVSLAKTSGGYVFPVEPSRHPVQRAIELDHEGKSFSREPNYFLARSQDLAPVYFDVGQFYVARREVWLERESFHDEGTPIKVEPGSMIDVDTDADWTAAEALFAFRNQHRARD